LYYTTDANFNVTAVIDDSGNVVERYAYDAYGQVTVLDTDWTADADGASDVDNRTLYAGYHHDSETGLYHVRNRMYHPTLGRWVQRDPLGYVDGMSVYQYGLSVPNRFVDWLGTDVFEDATEARRKANAAKPNVEEYRDSQGNVTAGFMDAWNNWQSLKKHAEQLEAKAAAERREILRRWFESVANTVVNKTSDVLKTIGQEAQRLSRQAESAGDKLLKKLAEEPLNKAKRIIPKIAGAASPRPSRNINKGPMPDNKAGRVRRADGTFGSNDEIADRMRKTGTKGAKSVDMPPSVARKAVDEVKGEATGALIGEIVAAYKALDQFEASSPCGKWYTASAKAIQKAAKTGDPKCCDIIFQGGLLATRSSLSSNCFEQIFDNANEKMALNWEVYAEWLQKECRKIAAKKPGGDVKLPKYKG
jgi:RHS repeat-associated protein